MANSQKTLCVNNLESEVGRKIIGVKCKQAKGRGWRNLKIAKGFIHGPSNGWGDKDYFVIVEGNQSEYLGQGCISTPGLNNKQEHWEGEKPMFPPHVGGSRICIS